MKNKKILQSNELSCVACSQRKIIIRPLLVKTKIESLIFLKQIQDDICGIVDPLGGTFRYFMVLVDASTRYGPMYVYYQFHNMAFARLLRQLIRLRAHFPDYLIKKMRPENASEFTSQTFNDYCMSIGIDVEHPMVHVHE